MVIGTKPSDSSESVEPQKETTIELRKPAATDGFDVSELVGRCPPLDTNSTYCNLLQCDHFSETSVIAHMNGEVVGFISGYLIPSRPNVLFIWQVAVDERARGHGLASKMLKHILSRDSLVNVTFTETTITPGNSASENLFKRLAASLGAELSTQLQYSRADHFGGRHADEMLHRIGPFRQSRD